MGHFTLRDPGLAPSGHAKLNWVIPRMPVLGRIAQRFQQERPLAGERIAISLHLEAKTAVLAQVLHEGGAEVAITSSNPLTAQDDVAAALAERGVEVHAFRGTTDAEFDQLHQKVLDIEPTLVIDDGGELTARLHGDRSALAVNIHGGAEETTTGVTRLKALAAAGALKYPMIAVNDADMKHLFDNRYGTGQSTWDGIMRTTNLVVAGTTVVVAGYGWCGKGVADRARGLGARVIVTEIDPVRANEALMDGFSVMTMQQAAPLGDFFVTVTGNRDVITGEHFLSMKDGAVLANAGHFDVEVSVSDLDAIGQEKVPGRNANVSGYRMPNGRTLWLLAEGRLVNLAAGDGHPAEIMDLTFALQALSLEHLLHHPKAPGVYPVDPEIDRYVAAIRLESLGIAIDQLSEAQRTYMASW
ncbi:MAG: adenosylhomocysteinase [Sulfobacillus benefaciens]|uniref:Adenosylhomocysteinase n=1 Tax=Sulfobacillus benefaciens TaxID=453960 RepID=A0A2T2XDJ8_9FIRM|nr:MAG: adenosylhomocysteinase [Sulfobacillus benefaciens]